MAQLSMYCVRARAQPLDWRRTEARGRAVSPVRGGCPRGVAHADGSCDARARAGFGTAVSEQWRAGCDRWFSCDDDGWGAAAPIVITLVLESTIQRLPCAPAGR